MLVHRVLFVLLAGLLVFAGCSRKEDQSADVRDFSPAKNAGGLTFQAPADWKEEQPTSRMRRAQYTLPKAEGDKEDGQVVVFYFGGSGGSVQANIDRWVGMFAKDDGSPAATDSKVDKKTVNGLPVTVVDVSGTYTNQSMGPMAGGGGDTSPKPNYRMLAAIAETKTGPWFFRLTGPKSTVEKWEKSFRAFLDTVKEG